MSNIRYTNLYKTKHRAKPLCLLGEEVFFEVKIWEKE